MTNTLNLALKACGCAKYNLEQNLSMLVILEKPSTFALDS